MQSPSPRFRSQQFSLIKQDMRRNVLSKCIQRDLHGEAILEPIRMGSNIVAGRERCHVG